MLMNKEDGLCYCTHVHVADIRECQDTSGIEDDDYGDELFIDWTRGAVRVSRENGGNLS